jgi:integrase/recombinase XerD
MQISRTNLKKHHQFYLEQYLSNCSLNNKSEHTLKNYSVDLVKFLNWYEAHYRSPLHKAKGDVIENYKHVLTHGAQYSLEKKKNILISLLFGWMTIFFKKFVHKTHIQRPLAVSSRKRHLSSIKNFFEYLKQYYEDKNSRFLINPVKEKIHGIKLKDIDVTHTPMLTRDMWHSLDEKLFRTKERLITHLLYFAGLRLHELCQLRFSDFDFESHSLKVRRKGGKVHHFKPQRASEIFYLLKIHQKDAESEWLFPTSSGHKPVSSRSLYHSIKKLLRKTGCPSLVSPHSFRKACATNLYLETKDLLFVRDYLNHADAKVTQTYIDQHSLIKSGVKIQ